MRGSVEPHPFSPQQLGSQWHLVPSPAAAAHVLLAAAALLPGAGCTGGQHAMEHAAVNTRSQERRQPGAARSSPEHSSRQGMQCTLASRRCTHSARTRLRLDGGFKFVLAHGETATQVCVAAALGVQLSPALVELVPQLLRAIDRVVAAIDRVVAVSEQPGIFLLQ